MSQPGKGKSLTLRASRTRLVMTMPESVSGAAAGEEWPFSAFTGGSLKLNHLVGNGGAMKIQAEAWS